MPLEILYLVMASSGVYDCFSTWCVAALPTLDAALDYRDKAALASKEAIDAYKLTPEGRASSYMYFDSPTRYDLAHSVRDTPVRYRVEPLPFAASPVDRAGLMPLADAYATAQGVTRELNYPGFSQRAGKPGPMVVADVSSDFAAKLKKALTST